MSRIEEYKKYQRSQIAEMTDWGEGFNMKGVSVSEADRANGSPKHGDKIARNPKNHADKWLVAAEYFADNFTEFAAGKPVAFFAGRRLTPKGTYEFYGYLNGDIELENGTKLYAAPSAEPTKLIDAPYCIVCGGGTAQKYSCKCQKIETTNAATAEGTLGSVNQAGSTPAPVVAAPQRSAPVPTATGTSEPSTEGLRHVGSGASAPDADAELIARLTDSQRSLWDTVTVCVLLEQAADCLTMLAAERDRMFEANCFIRETQKQDYERAEKAEQRAAELEASLHILEEELKQYKTNGLFGAGA